VRVEELADEPREYRPTICRVTRDGESHVSEMRPDLVHSAGVEQQLEEPKARSLDIPGEYRSAILDGLRGAASAPGSISIATSTATASGPLRVKA